MPMKAAAAAAASSMGGGTIICSHHRRHFLSLKGVSSNIIPTCSSSNLITSQFPLVSKPKPNLNLKFICRAADSTPQPSSAPIHINKSVVPDDEFSLAKVWFWGIFQHPPGSEWSAIMLTYGFPLAIIGMALKYAELKPVPCLTYSDAQVLREKCATPILKQVRDDVIRYRYGDEQHLEEALKRILQYGLGGGIPQRSAPTLQLIREEVTEDGKCCLVLVFEAKDLQLSDFEKRQAKFASFFGPGITAEVAKGEENIYEVRLISHTTL